MTDIPPQALRAREMYLAGAILDRIRAETGLSTGMIYHWLGGGKGPPGARPLPALPRRRIVRRMSQGRAASRAALIARMMRAADLQVTDIEQRLAQAGLEGAPLDREREARVLAVLARTLRELIALDAQQDHDKRKPKTEDDDPPPRDLDELRRELAHRIDRLRAGTGAATAGGDAGG